MQPGIKLSIRLSITMVIIREQSNSDYIEQSNNDYIKSCSRIYLTEDADQHRIKNKQWLYMI